MLMSSNAKFHIVLVSWRWFLNSDSADLETILAEPTFSAISGDKFGIVEHVTQIDYSYLENIRGQHVFTENVRQEMTQKQQRDKGLE